MSKNFNIKKTTFRILTLAVVLGIGYNFVYRNDHGDRYVIQKTAVLSNQQVANLNLEDPTVKSLYDLYNKNDKTIDNKSLYKILNDIDNIPSELLELAVRNNQTFEFVSNYSYHLDDNNVSIKNDYTPGEIPLFLQWDERWGYHQYADEIMAINGCAPTSLAMVIVGLTGDTSINPQVIADYSYDNGFYEDGIGTSWNLLIDGAKHFGVNSQYLYINEDSVISSLKKGNVIVASVKPGIFTTTGHILVITGIDKDGNLIINDPNSKINSSKPWNIEVFLNEVKALWEMSV